MVDFLQGVKFRWWIFFYCIHILRTKKLFRMIINKEIYPNKKKYICRL